MENKKVLVKWMDARIYPGMHKLDEALSRKMDIFESLGYLVDKNDEATKIAHEITDNGEYRDILLIPSGSVISIQELVTGSPM
ncbi:MAG: hypothetical protein FJ006_09025 [Chloroflexi bacterium]|nr:hypothetical protein [Chloroflexota bacterium]